MIYLGEGKAQRYCSLDRSEGFGFYGSTGMASYANVATSELAHEAMFMQFLLIFEKNKNKVYIELKSFS